MRFFFLFIATLALASAHGITTGFAATDKEVAAKKLIQVMEYKKLYTDMVQQTGAVQTQSIMNHLLQMMPSDTKPVCKNALSSDMAKSFQQRFFTLIPYENFEKISIDLWMEYFTAQEMNELAAFHSTPTGQKMLKLMPQMMSESIIKFNALIEPKVPQIFEEVKTELDSSMAAFKQCQANTP